MKTQIYSTLPQEARRIREEVFVREQGFENEFDETDQRAFHLVLYDGEIPVAVCRFFPRGLCGDYVVGRIAVIKEYRGRKLGACLLREAEKELQAAGGKRILLHAQCRAAGFYEKQGYASRGEIDFDEDCPHIWMGKEIGGERA